MDWLLEPATPQVASALRTELAAYLRRHATDPDAVFDAEVVISELLANAVEHAVGPIWVSLEWGAPRAVLAVHDMGAVFTLATAPPDTAQPRGRGLWLVGALAADLRVAANAGGGKQVRATLPVVRHAPPVNGGHHYRSAVQAPLEQLG